MSWLLALAISVLVAAGVFLTLSRSILRCVIGISLIGSGANLVVFASGRIGSDAPPVIPAGGKVLLDSANPLPQAMVLTAIVIGFALTCFSLVLALAVQQRTGIANTDALRQAEPREGEDGMPVTLNELN